MLIAVAKWGIIINTLFYVYCVCATVIFFEKAAPSSKNFEKFQIKNKFRWSNETIRRL